MCFDIIQNIAPIPFLEILAQFGMIRECFLKIVEILTIFLLRSSQKIWKTNIDCIVRFLEIILGTVLGFVCCCCCCVCVCEKKGEKERSERKEKYRNIETASICFVSP